AARARRALAGGDLRAQQPAGARRCREGRRQVSTPMPTQSSQSSQSFAGVASSRLVVAATACTVAGVIASILGAVLTPERAVTSLLLHAFYIVSLGVSAAFFAATQRLTGARWSAALRRIPEAFMMTLPLGAILVAVVLLFGRTSLYPWALPNGLAHEPQF